MGKSACGGGANFSAGGNSYCNEGYEGALCASCSSGFFSDSTLNTCERCGEASVSPVFIVFVTTLVIAFVVVARRYRLIRFPKEMTQKWCKELPNTDVAKEAEDGAEDVLGPVYRKLKPKLKIMWAFSQLVSSMGFTLGVTFPDLYSAFLSILDVANFDFFQVIPLNCVVSTNYYFGLLMTTLFPLGLCGILRCVYLIWKSPELKSTLFWLFLLLAYLVLPACTSVLLRMFKCDYFEDVDTEFMVADYSLVCSKGNEVPTARFWWTVYAGIMVLVYPIGIPLMFAVLLWQHRFKLCPNLQDRGIWYLLIRQREWDDEKAPDDDPLLSFLTSGYEPHAFWFEVVECIRRLMLSSMLILVGDGSAAQVVVALFICLFSIKVYSYYKPFVEDEDDVLAEIAQWQLFCVFFAALMIRLDASGDSASDQAALSGLLIFVTLSGFLVLIGLATYDVWVAYKEDKEEEEEEEEALARDADEEEALQERKGSSLRVSLSSIYSNRAKGGKEKVDAVVGPMAENPMFDERSRGTAQGGSSNDGAAIHGLEEEAGKGGVQGSRFEGEGECPEDIQESEEGERGSDFVPSQCLEKFSEQNNQDESPNRGSNGLVKRFSFVGKDSGVDGTLRTGGAVINKLTSDMHWVERQLTLNDDETALKM